jgi:uncharacterized beta-barrel protein YwiB (DUF1934 family)
MTKDVILTISGLHATDGESDAPVEIMAPAQYYQKNGKHYVLFEEVLEGLEGKIKSTIKFTENSVELLRSGAAATRMVFEKEKEHSMLYQTAMGPLWISVYTEEIFVHLEESKMNISIEYLLKSGDDVITESSVYLKIRPKETAVFS